MANRTGPAHRAPRRRHAAPRPPFALPRLILAEVRSPAPLLPATSVAVLTTALVAGGVVIGSQRLDRVGDRVATSLGGAPVELVAAGADLEHGPDRFAPSAKPSPPSTNTAAPLLGAVATPAPPVTVVPPDGLQASERRLSAMKTEISPDISPKSVIGNGHGLFFAQNMMYRHSVTVYNRQAELVATISDRIRLSDYGYPEYPGEVSGSPVEAVATSNGRYVYVSNYEMDGPGFTHPGNDDCAPGGWDPSFVYRIDTTRFAIDQVIKVGSVPKYVALTPNEKHLLVANWCSYDLSVVDVASGAEIRRVPIGPYPRGIVADARRNVAYVAVMGSTSIAVVDLATFDVSWLRDVGLSPRHVVLSPDGATLYATLNGAGQVARIDVASGAVTALAHTGSAPRSMAISDDGTALYVVNYLSNSLSKVRTADMAVTQTVPMFDQPIGVAYDAPSRTVWVSVYAGGIVVLSDSAAG